MSSIGNDIYSFDQSLSGVGVTDLTLNSLTTSALTVNGAETVNGVLTATVVDTFGIILRPGANIATNSTQVTDVQISYLNSLSSNVQTQIDEIQLQIETAAASSWLYTGNFVYGNNYEIGNIVRYNLATYVALSDNTNQYPTNILFFALINYDGTNGINGINGNSWSYRGNFIYGNTYTIGNVVRYNLATYVALSDNTNQYPTNTIYFGLINFDGTNGTNGDSFTFLGNYVNGTRYYPNEVIYYLGASYIALIENIYVPPTETTKWGQMVAAGTNGLNGINGNKGDKGDTGDTGDAGQIDAATIAATIAAGGLAGGAAGASAGTYSGGIAGTTSGGLAGTLAAETAYEFRVDALEKKTFYQSTNLMSGKTEFISNIVVKGGVSNLSSKVVLDTAGTVTCYNVNSDTLTSGIVNSDNVISSIVTCNSVVPIGATLNIGSLAGTTGVVNVNALNINLNGFVSMPMTFFVNQLGW